MKNTIFEAVVDYFDRDEWNYELCEETLSVTLGCQGQNGRWRCHAVIQPDIEQFIFYSILENGVPSDKLETVVEYITRINYGMLMGNFELDYNDGEIRFKTYCLANEEQLSYELIGRTVYSNILVMDRYFLGFMRIMYGELTPLEALTLAEPIEEEIEEGVN